MNKNKNMWVINEKIGDNEDFFTTTNLEKTIKETYGEEKYNESPEETTKVFYNEYHVVKMM